jgi:hypothetical protein
MFFFESLLQQSNKNTVYFFELLVFVLIPVLRFFTQQSMTNHEHNNKRYKHVLFFNLLHLHLFLHDMFFKILTIFMQEFVLRFSGSQPSASHAAVIFMNHNILQRIHALQELLLIRNIMTFADAQQHFVVLHRNILLIHNNILLLHRNFLRILMFVVTQRPC